MKKTNSIKNILSMVLIIAELLIIVLLAFTRLSGGIPAVFGRSLFVIGSGSMEPVLSTGDLIISRKYEDGQSLEAGDIVTYTAKEGAMAGMSITHEIIAVDSVEGQTVITTQGRSNNIPDPAITPDQIEGVMVRRSVILSFIYRVMSTLPGFLILFVIPMLIFMGQEIRELVKSCRNAAASAEGDIKHEG